MKKEIKIMSYTFKAKCTADYMEDDDCGELFIKDKEYQCKTSDFKTFEIEAEYGGTANIGPSYLIEDFNEYFTTDFKVHFPTEWLSPTTKDSIYREIWCEHVKEDIKSRCEDLNISLTDDAINDIAYRYVYEGQYDCNLSYWQNLDNHIEAY